jgi:ATP-dependent DNA helicase RecG
MTELSSLTGVGPKTALYLNNLGIFSYIDLINYCPHRFLDFSVSKKIVDYDLNLPATYSGKIIKFQSIYTRQRKSIQKATIADSTGNLDLIWFNQPYLDKQVVSGNTISVAGTVSLFKNKITLISPIIGNKTGRIVPIYHQSSEIKSSQIEKIIHQNFSILIKEIKESLPQKIVKQHDLINLEIALRWIHQPANQQQIKLAKIRIDLQSALYFAASSHLQKTSINAKKVSQQASKIPPLEFYYMTQSSQRSAWDVIQTELLLDTPCHRLLCGDVGSGKTIIALMAANLISHNQQISLVVAPTQILAHQHYLFFKKVLPKNTVVLLDKKNINDKFAKNSIIISTHLAFYQNPEFLKRIALLIVDEQHKFGVSQRNFLSNLIHPPHCLTLSATPIPRTLALSIYGHLQISYLAIFPTGNLTKLFGTSSQTKKML